jgi:hypothetical protein
MSRRIARAKGGKWMHDRKGRRARPVRQERAPNGDAWTAKEGIDIASEAADFVKEKGDLGWAAWTF